MADLHPRRPDLAGALPLLLALGVLVLVGGAAWWFLGTHELHEPNGRTLRATPRAGALTPESVAPAPTTRTADAIVTRDDRDATSGSIPAATESVLRELAGLRGRVVEASGTPVAELRVELLRIDPDVLVTALESGFSAAPADFTELVVARDVTRGDGSFLLREVEVGTFTLLGIDLGGPRATLRTIDVAFERGRTCDCGDVVLPPHGTLVGVVVDEAGAPIAGARVRVLAPECRPLLPAAIPPELLTLGLHDLRSDCALLAIVEGTRCVVELPRWLAGALERLPLPTTVSGDDGRFRLTGAPAGLGGGGALIVDHAGFLGTVVTSTTVAAGAETDVGTQRLTRGRHVSGRVVAGGQPVAGARVLVGTSKSLRSPIGPATVAIGQPAGVTNEAGRFELDGLPEQGELLCAVQPRAGESWLLLQPHAADDLRLELPLTATLTLLVTDLAGHPIEQAELRLLEATPLNALPLLGRPSDGHGRVEEEQPGRYVVRELRSGRWQLLARAPGFVIATQPVELPPQGATVTLKLAATRTLQVQVVDAATRMAVAQALVAVLVDEAAFHAAPFASPFPSPFKVARSDWRGRATLDQLPTAALTLRVTHPGFTRQAIELPPSLDEHDGDPIACTVALRRGGDLVGRITQGGAAPVTPLLLVVEPHGSGLPDFEPPRSVVTRLDGAFELRQLPAGPCAWRVRPRSSTANPLEILASAPDGCDDLAHGECDVAEGSETRLDIDALLESAITPASLRGRVRTRFPNAVAPNVQLVGRRDSAAACDASGRFEFAGLPPGDYRLRVVETLGGASSLLHEQVVRLLPGEEKELDVEVRTLAIELQVSTRGGAAVAGAAISVTPLAAAADAIGDGDAAGSEPIGRGEESCETATDGAGRARLILQPGRWRATVRHEEEGFGTREFELGAAPAKRVEIVVDPGVVLAGSLEFDGSAPNAERWYLMLRPVESDGERADSPGSNGGWTAVSPDDRRFRFTRVRAGRYRAQLILPDINSEGLWSDEFEIGANGGHDVVLQLRATR